MATITSNPTSLTVLTPGDSALSRLATQMASGTWAQLTVNNQNSILGVGAHTSSMIPYCNVMPWNQRLRAIEILGMDHGYPAMRHARFDEASGQFVLVADNAGIGTGHGYDHCAINPTTGDLYYRVYSGFSGEISVRRKLNGASAFTSVPSVSALEQVALGVCWWSGPFIGAGAQGALMVFNSGNATGSANDGHVVGFDPLASRWFFNRTGLAPFYGSGSTYHSVMEYSATKNVAVFGGGNVAGRKLWRLNADGSSTPMPDVPAGKSVGIQQGLLVDDPVSGNFLLLSAGQLWELNPSGSGTWTQQTGSRTPPAGVAVPSGNNGNVTCSAISTYGVIAFITQNASSGGTFFLYKHA